MDTNSRSEHNHDWESCRICSKKLDDTPRRFDRPPGWTSDAIFYQIFPDRFASSDRVEKPPNLEAWDSPPTIFGYKGGDLPGILEHLDYIEELGINAIYLNPVFASASNHRYHTWDYYRVDPMLGGDDAFEDLLAECHQRGIRVVIDGVFNHCGRGFLQFNDLLENGQSSAWVDWFIVESWPLHAYDGQKPGYHAWWGNAALPKFNTDNAQVAEYLIKVGEHWARKGVDGWRLDVPNEITTEGFWEEFRQRVRAINPDLYLVGEIWEDATDWIVRGDRFDGTMNYHFGGRTIAFTAGSRVNAQLTAGLPFPVSPPLDAPGYGEAVEDLLFRYPRYSHLANLNLLGSHDTARLLSVADGDVDSVILSTLLNFTFPGAPSIYYGDEIGMSGGNDPGSRGAFPWSRTDLWNDRLLRAHRSLIALRSDHRALRHGEYRRLSADNGSSLYAFAMEDEDERLLIAVNVADIGSSVTIEDETLGSKFTTLWGSGGIKCTDGTLHLALPPRSGAVWKMSQ